jgi:putative spermidine/putrescine transport system permease protein
LWNPTLILSLSPGLLVVGFFFALPLIVLFWVSLTDQFPGASHVTLKNYLEVLQSRFHLRSFLTSLKLSVVVTLLTGLIGYPISYYLVRVKSRWKGVVFIAILSPLLISLVVRSLGWMILLGRQGIINWILVQLGLIDQPIQLIYTFWAVIVGEVHVLLPFMVLSITSVLNQVPSSLEDAAGILGAPPWRRFVSVTLPLSAPGLIAGCFLVFALSMGSYITPQMLGGGKVGVVTLDIYDRMLVIMDWPVGAALAVVLMLSTLLAALGMGYIQKRLGSSGGTV